MSQICPQEIPEFLNSFGFTDQSTIAFSGGVGLSQPNPTAIQSGGYGTQQYPTTEGINPFGAQQEYNVSQIYPGQYYPPMPTTNWSTIPGYHPQVIRLGEMPTQAQWVYEPYYKVAANGKYLEWQAGFDGVNRILTWHGYHMMKMQTDSREVVPKAGRNIYEQAMLEINQKYNEAYHDGYRPPGSTDKPFLDVMKAEPFAKGQAGMTYPAAVQPKLDGIRMAARRMPDGSIDCRSANNHQFTITVKYIKPALDRLFRHLGDVEMIDGELIILTHPETNQHVDFNFVQSVVTTQKFEHQYLRFLQYHIFDVDYNPRRPFEERWTKMYTAHQALCADSENGAYDCFYLKLVETYIISDEEQMWSYYNYFRRQYYEGAMVRKLANGAPEGSKNFTSSLYEHKRTRNILKVKTFYDAEGIITGYTSGKGRNEGAVIFQVMTANGKYFEAIPIGVEGVPLPIEERRRMFQEGQRYLGTEVTYRYFEISKDGVPRFPHIIKWNRLM